MFSIKRQLIQRHKALLLLVAALLLATFPAQVFAQAAPEIMDRTRTLEAQINQLQSELTVARNNYSEAVERLQEIESEVLGCYARIETAEQKVQSAINNLKLSMRSMYVDGQKNAVIKLLSADDTADFLIKYDYMLELARKEASDYELFKENRSRLQSEREQLLSRKEEQARLTSSIETSGIEAELQSKKAELADLQASLISSQAINTGINSGYSPGRVFSQPDIGSFVTTGQGFSGYSSWYGPQFHGRATSSGEIYNQYGFTCAHKTLPFGTWLKVTFRGVSVVVKVNDRGPFVAGRVLDLSRGAADAIGMTGAGVGWVQCEIVVPK